MESGVQRSDLDRDLAWKYVPSGNLLRQNLIICTAGGSVQTTTLRQEWSSAWN